jgi:hypothetical protein
MDPVNVVRIAEGIAIRADQGDRGAIEKLSEISSTIAEALIKEAD